jgi:hypothetical protein
MKRSILTYSLLGLISAASAQLVPNGDFKTTSAPTGWIGASGSVSITNEVNLGSAGHLKGEDGLYFGFIQNTSQVGVMASNKFAFTGRPTSLRFLACYFPVKAGETLGIFVQFTKKNTGTGKIDTVGIWQGAAAPGTINPWRQITLDLTNYKLPDNPDSAIVAFFATVNAGAGTGTALCVDDIKFSEFAAGITEVDNYFYGKVSVQPNPINSNSNAIVNYTLNGETDVTIGIYDLMGRKVSDVFEGREGNGQHQHSISKTGLEAGTYLLKITSGTFAKTEKIVIQ